MPKLFAVTLYVRPGLEREFRNFEERALAIGARHGGELMAAMRLAPEALGEEQPYEFHLLSFPDEAAFLAWGQDPDYRALEEERDSIIAKIDLKMGEDCTQVVRDPLLESLEL